MFAAATLTMTVHLVELIMVRRTAVGSGPGRARLFGFEWSSLLYALDVVVWDLLVGISLVFAALVFTGRRHTIVRRGLLGSGVLCPAGLIRPATTRWPGGPSASSAMSSSSRWHVWP
jgi:hypothetical protein